MLQTTQQNLTTSISTLENQQQDYTQKQSAYKSQKAESDELLKQLEDEQQTYSEYRNQDQAELNAVNAEIAKAAEIYKKKLEAKRKRKLLPLRPPQLLRRHRIIIQQQSRKPLPKQPLKPRIIQNLK